MNQKIQNLLNEPPADTASIKLCLASSSENLTLIRRLITASIRHANFSKEDIEGIKLSAMEACTNVIKHAHKYDINKKFYLEIYGCHNAFIMKIIYNDPEFKPENIPIRNLNEIREGGYGVFLMRKLMDYINYETNTNTGNVCLQMVKLTSTNNNDETAGGSRENRMSDRQ